MDFKYIEIYLVPPSCYYVIVNTLPSLMLCQEQRVDKVCPSLNYLGLEVTNTTSTHVPIGKAGKYSISHGYLVSVTLEFIL